MLNTNDYAGAVLKAVNFGRDTDTTGCVSGGLAGLFYGYEAIDKTWISKIARMKDIENLCERLNDTISQ